MLELSGKLFELAQNIADNTPDFFDIKGPGRGDKSTAAFMQELRRQANNMFRADFSEKTICGSNKFSFDFFFPGEATAVEIALTLRNSNSEFTKDIIKAILSQKDGNKIKTLMFISKPGAHKRHGEPASKSIISLVEREFGICVVIKELTNNNVRETSHNLLSHVNNKETSNKNLGC